MAAIWNSAPMLTNSSGTQAPSRKLNAERAWSSTYINRKSPAQTNSVEQASACFLLTFVAAAKEVTNLDKRGRDRHGRNRLDMSRHAQAKKKIAPLNPTHRD